MNLGPTPSCDLLSSHSLLVAENCFLILRLRLFIFSLLLTLHSLQTALLCLKKDILPKCHLPKLPLFLSLVPLRLRSDHTLRSRDSVPSFHRLCCFWEPVVGLPSSEPQSHYLQFCGCSTREFSVIWGPLSQLLAYTPFQDKNPVLFMLVMFSITSLLSSMSSYNRVPKYLMNLLKHFPKCTNIY